MDCVDLEGLELKQITEVAEYIFPIVPSFDFSSGTHGNSLGVSVSIGIPKIFPLSVRKEFSVSTNSPNQGSQLQSTNSTDITVLGGISWKQTKYNSGPTSQTTAEIKVGTPIYNVSTSNDLGEMGGDGGDRFRTASGNLHVLSVDFGFRLQTEDPGLISDDRRKYLGDDFGPNGTYITTPKPDDRQGIVYLGIGVLKIGSDSEKNRNFIQNKVVHDNIGSARFKTLDTAPKNFVEISNK